MFLYSLYILILLINILVLIFSLKSIIKKVKCNSLFLSDLFITCLLLILCFICKFFICDMNSFYICSIFSFLSFSIYSYARLNCPMVMILIPIVYLFICSDEKPWFSLVLIIYLFILDIFIEIINKGANKKNGQNI